MRSFSRIIPPLLLTLCLSNRDTIVAQARFPAKVIVDIGGLLDTPGDELSRVSSAFRTKSGQILIGQGNPAEVRLYDNTGKLLRRIGRPGQGPGEFRTSAIARPWAGDSVLALSTGGRRWTLFGLDGRIVREWPLDSLHPVPFTVGLNDWAFTRTGVVGSRGCPTNTLSKLPTPNPWELREAETDEAGRTWLRVSDVNWQIYSPAGILLGTTTLPARLFITQFSGDLVIGRHLDSEDAEHVVLIQVRLPGAASGSVPCEIPVTHDPRSNSMRTAMGNLRTAGEAVRSDSGRYPSKVPTRLVVLPEDTEATIITAASKSWAALLRDKKSTFHCVFSFGPDGIPGWQDGALACSK